MASKASFGVWSTEKAVVKSWSFMMNFSLHRLLRSRGQKRYVPQPTTSRGDRLNSCIATNAERRRALVFGVGEQRHDVLPKSREPSGLPNPARNASMVTPLRGAVGIA